MKKVLKSTVKKIIIYIVICMLILSSITPISLAYTVDEVGGAIAGVAVHIVDSYRDHIDYSQSVRTANPIWQPDSYSWDDEKYSFDCSSFASGCANYATGGKTPSSVQYTGSMIAYSNPDMENIRITDVSQLKLGDLFYHDTGENAHATVYVGSGSSEGDLAEVGGANSDGEGGSLGDCGYRDAASYLARGYEFYALRVTEEGAKNITTLNTEFSLTQTVSASTGKSIDYSNFFFNGVPDGKYSLASRKNIFEVLVESLKDLINFFTGLISYLFRGFIIGVISIFDRLLNNTVASINESPRSLEESGVTATSADDPYSMNRSVTIEGLVFNNIDLFDINIFKVD